MASFARCRNAPPPPSTKQWNPGNYIASTTNDNASIWDKVGTGPGTEGVLQRFNADTGDLWRGALLRFQWTDLEGDTLGSYNAGMNVLKGYLDTVATSYPTKRIIVFIALKTFGATNNAVPLYMRNGSDASYNDPDGYGNGQYAYDSGNGGPGGFVPNVHVNAVRDRLKALMAEMATRFNNHAALECITYSEASINQPIQAVTWDTTPWFTNMTNVFTDMKTNFTNIQICQWINASRADMAPWVPTIRALGVGVGMPDLCPEEKGFNFRNDYPGQASTNPGNIQHCQNSNGTGIIIGHASKPAQSGTVVGRSQVSGTQQGQPHVYPTYPGLGTSRQAVHDFAVNTVGVTHFCIAHNTGNQPVTGETDPAAPASADPYTAFTGYGGVKFNTITDNWIKDPTSSITTITTRPSGW